MNNFRDYLKYFEFQPPSAIISGMDLPPKRTRRSPRIADGHKPDRNLPSKITDEVVEFIARCIAACYTDGQIKQQIACDPWNIVHYRMKSRAIERARQYLRLRNLRPLDQLVAESAEFYASVIRQPLKQKETSGVGKDKVTTVKGIEMRDKIAARQAMDAVMGINRGEGMAAASTDAVRVIKVRPIETVTLAESPVLEAVDAESRNPPDAEIV